MAGGGPKRGHACKQKQSTSKGKSRKFVAGNQQDLQDGVNSMWIVNANPISHTTAPGRHQPSTSISFESSLAGATLPLRPALPVRPLAIHSSPDLQAAICRSWPSGNPRINSVDPGYWESTPQGALGDRISSKLDSIITSIDSETFSGEERDLGIKPTSELTLTTTKRMQSSTNSLSPVFGVEGVPKTSNSPKVPTKPSPPPLSAQTISLKPPSTQILAFHQTFRL